MERNFHCVAELQIRNRYGVASVISLYLKQLNYLFSCVLSHKQRNRKQSSCMFISLKTTCCKGKQDKAMCVCVCVCVCSWIKQEINASSVWCLFNAQHSQMEASSIHFKLKRTSDVRQTCQTGVMALLINLSQMSSGTYCTVWIRYRTWRALANLD